MASVIDTRDLTKKYKQSTALDNVNLSIEEDSIYGSSAATVLARQP